jgi:hypothetical protein
VDEISEIRQIEATVMADLTPQDQSLLDSFRMRVREFAEAFRTLLDTEPDVRGNPALEQEFDELKDTGTFIKDTVDTITKTVDAVTGYFRDTFGLDGMPTRGGLGFVGVLLPVAAITAAIAWMGSYVSDVYMFNRKVQEAKQLEAQGYTPREAADIAHERVSDSPVADSIKSVAKVAGFLGGAYLLVRLFG